MAYKNPGHLQNPDRAENAYVTVPNIIFCIERWLEIGNTTLGSLLLAQKNAWAKRLLSKSSQHSALFTRSSIDTAALLENQEAHHYFYTEFMLI